MATVTQYICGGGTRDEDPREYEGTFVTFNYQEAKDYARRNSEAVIAYEYEYSDSQVIDDFRNEPEEEVE